MICPICKTRIILPEEEKDGMCEFCALQKEKKNDETSMERD